MNHRKIYFLKILQFIIFIQYENREKIFNRSFLIIKLHKKKKRRKSRKTNSSSFPFIIPMKLRIIMEITSSIGYVKLVYHCLMNSWWDVTSNFSSNLFRV